MNKTLVEDDREERFRGSGRDTCLSDPRLSDHRRRSTARTERGADTLKRVSFTVIDQAVHLLDTLAEPWGIHMEIALDATWDEERLLGPEAIRRFADRFDADRLAPAESGR